MNRSRNPLPDRSTDSKLTKSPDVLRATPISQTKARPASQNRNDIKYKTIRIEYNDEIQVTLKIEAGNSASSSKYTTSLLLQEAKAQLEISANNHGEEINASSIVALQTPDQNLAIDYWLTLPNNSLDILNDKITLIAYLRTKRLSSKNNEFALKDFEIIKAIGRGGFSKVYLARFKETGAFCCLKSMKRDLSGVYEEVDKAFEREREALSEIENPFILKLVGSFQSGNYSYLVLEFVPGGDVKTHLERLKFLSESDAKFYFAEMLLAFNYLHENNYIYRDIKPENFLIDAEGHIKLVDFGSTKKIKKPDALNYSYCGTIDYMTPEMVQKKGYDITIDYYGLGALLYEMVVGVPPFSKFTEERELVQAIVSTKPIMPSKLSNDLRDLLLRLLEKDPRKRLGAKGGIKEIMSHAWFSDVKFGLIIEKKIIPPIKVEFKKMHFGPKDDCIDISSEEAANESSVDLDNMRDDDDDLQEEQKQTGILEETLPGNDPVVLSQLELKLNNSFAVTVKGSRLEGNYQTPLQDTKKELIKNVTKDISGSKKEGNPVFPQKPQEIDYFKSNLPANIHDGKNKAKPLENSNNKKAGFFQNFSLKKFMK